MKEEILLSGNDWALSYFMPGEGKKAGEDKKGKVGMDKCNTGSMSYGWLKANVPGDVHFDLIKKKIIPDPYFGINNEKSKWVSDCEWWYKKVFSIPEDWEKEGKVIRLIFEGVDYDAEFWVMGEYLGKHTNMYTPIIFDITKIVKNSTEMNLSEMNLSVCISPPPKNRIEIGGRKCNLAYGIDYAPVLLTMGIWKDVKLVCTGENYFEDIFIESEIKKEKALIKLEMEIINTCKNDKTVDFEIDISGKNFSCQSYKKKFKNRVKSGKNIIKTEVEIQNPKLWWPWDKGEQNLYQVQAKIFEGEEEQDSVERIFGIREIRMIKNPDSPKDSYPFVFTINGKKEYIKGANWTNINLLPGDLKEDKYKKLLNMAKEANMNMLRVHGWHIIEKKEFYNLCDELGILIWQEFSFCNLNYPQDKIYLKEVEEECSQVIKTIKNHPSLVVWCAGNEYIYGPNKKLVDTLERICHKYDSSRYFLPPSDIDGCYDNSWNIWGNKLRDSAKFEYKGDSHSNLGGWIGGGFPPIEAYTKDESLFVSEFAFQGIPDVENIKKFIPKEELWPAGYTWEYHLADISKLVYYAYYIKTGIYDKEIKLQEAFKDLEEFVEYSQLSQAEGYKFAIEHYRRRKYKNSGCMFWCFNEPWPSIIWSIVDWYLKPKKAYYAVKNAYSPLLVCLKYTKKKWEKSEKFEAEAWIVNDYCDTFKNCLLEIRIIDGEGRVVEEKHIKIEKIEEDSAKQVFNLCWVIPEEIKDRFQISLKLVNSENLVIATNKYIFCKEK
ncbi:MAG: glycoside hydrolase family 2 TIM barrel-domain containing protein [Candidatus Firestonebacteria bacterium]